MEQAQKLQTEAEKEADDAMTQLEEFINEQEKLVSERASVWVSEFQRYEKRSITQLQESINSLTGETGEWVSWWASKHVSKWVT